ncbi:hypothetical protein LOTGIDRAFT_173864 [Lottia gigantea]|uniref:PH domain-containing protein n=1 Tax=Lottia gigantea TaxID=225164 RepID=V4APJ4_LOTGI|nr:hypothetical protein LOTGIDRAFT_173864 [Lottia gigantea]ESO99122.1 hypothetical protein LOTGIDRAFT_173864 [Lottia gigantea]
MEIIGIRYKENEDPVLTSVQHLLQQLSVNKHSQLAVNNINNIRRRYFSTSTPVRCFTIFTLPYKRMAVLKTLDDVTDRRFIGNSGGTPTTTQSSRRNSVKDGNKSLTMGTDIYSPSNGMRSSKRKPAPNPPTRSLSEGKAKHVLASDLSQCDMKGWLMDEVRAVSMDVTLSGSAERIANLSKDKSKLDIGQTAGYMPSPRISRRPEILNLGSPLLNNGQTSSLTDFRRRIRREEEPEHSPGIPLKASHSDEKNIQKSIKSKGLSLNFKSFGSLDSLVKKQKRSRSADDSMIPERRSLDDSRHRIISEMDVVDYPKSPNGHSRFKVLETSGLSDGIGPVVRRQVSDIKDRFFNGTSYSGVPGVRLGELTSEKASGYLQYRVMMKWINIWCVIARNCFYGFKTQNDYEIPIVAVVLKQCMVNYDSNTSRQTKDLNVFKLSQSHCKDIYLSAESAKELRRWLQHLKQFCPIHADDDLSIANSSECTQSYDSAFSNVSVASSHDFNDKPIIFTSTNSSPQNDEVFSTEARLDVSSPEDWEAFHDDDTISELNDPFNRPPPSLSLSARKEKNHFLHILRSKLKLNVIRKKSLPDNLERELMSPAGHGILVLDDSASSPSKKPFRGGSQSPLFGNNQSAIHWW